MGYSIAAADPDRLRNQVMSLRSRLGWSEHDEIKFHQMSDQRRKDFFDGIRALDFVVRGLIVYKPGLPDEYRVMEKSRIQGWFIGSLLAHMMPAELDGIRIVLDELSDMQKVIHALRRYIRANRIVGIKRIGGRRSTQELLIQLADMCVGAVLREAVTGECFHESIRDRCIVWRL